MRNRFHALCPYFAMFPEGFVERWVNELTRPGDLVADPFCGRGTTPFQALVMDRNALGSDINPVAYCLTKAKTQGPVCSTVLRRIAELRGQYEEQVWRPLACELPEFFQRGYNTSTLGQILYLRSVLDWRTRRVDTMIAALALGALHGESEKSPSYLSAQMPRTISTKPAYSVRFWDKHSYCPPERNAFELLHRQAKYRYRSPLPQLRGRVELSDFRELHRSKLVGRQEVKCIITSPPYLDVTNFEEDQWLRLWFLGGPPHPTRNRVSRDDRHELASNYWRMIADFWRIAGYLVESGGHVVVRMAGKGLSENCLVDGLTGCSVVAGRDATLVSRETSAIPRRQTDAFRPGSVGVRFEVDAVFQIR